MALQPEFYAGCMVRFSDQMLHTLEANGVGVVDAAKDIRWRVDRVDGNVLRGECVVAPDSAFGGWTPRQRLNHPIRVGNTLLFDLTGNGLFDVVRP